MSPKPMLQILNDAHIPSIQEEEKGDRYKSNRGLETLKNNLHGGVEIEKMGAGTYNGPIKCKYVLEMYKKAVDGKFVESDIQEK